MHVLQEGGVVVLRVLRAVESRHHAKPEPKSRLWEQPFLCLGARNLHGCASKQIHVPPAPSKQIHAARADDHARKMSGLVVPMAGGCGGGGWNIAEANEGADVVGCEGASGLPRQSRHNPMPMHIRVPPQTWPKAGKAFIVNPI